MNQIVAVLSAIFIIVSCTNESAEPSVHGLPEDAGELESLLTSDIKEEAKLSVYNKLVDYYFDQDPDKAYGLLEEEKELAEKIDNHLETGKAAYNMALIHKKNLEYIGAVEHYLQAINAFEKIEDKERISIVLDNLGNVFAETGNYDYAEKFFIKSRLLYSGIDKSEKLVIANMNLGICKFSKSEPDYESAAKYFEESLHHTEKLSMQEQSYYLNRIYSQIGTMYYKNSSYKKAVTNYLLSLNYIDVTQHIQRSIAYANIGEVYLGEGLYKEAGEWISKAVDIAPKIDDSQTVSGIYNIYAKLLQQMGRHEESVNYLEKSIAQANTKIINEPLQESLGLIRQSYAALRQSDHEVSADQYENILLIDAEQDALEDEMVSKLNYKALQAALGLSVELDHQRKEKQAEVKLNSTYTYTIIGMILLLIIGGYKLYKTGKKIYLIQQVLNWD